MDEVTSGTLWEAGDVPPAESWAYGLTDGSPPRRRRRGPGIVARTAQASSSLRFPDDLGRLEEDGGGNGEAEGFRGLEVDDQLELAGLLHREITRLGAFQNLVHIQ